MQATIENPTSKEMQQTIQAAAGLATLDEAARFLRRKLPCCFVYRGGSHVALHRRTNTPRIAIIV